MKNGSRSGGCSGRVYRLTRCWRRSALLAPGRVRKADLSYNAKRSDLDLALMVLARPLDPEPMLWRQIHGPIGGVRLHTVENRMMHESAIIDAARLTQG